MAILPLLVAPNPLLRQKSEPVSEITEAVKKIAGDIRQTMFANHTVGISGPMMGVFQRIIAVRVSEGDARIMINPEVVEQSAETNPVQEASPSYPGVSANIDRPKSLTVRYLDENGQTQELKAEGLTAACVLHEIEYLDGKSFLDNLSPVKRDMLMRKIVKHKRQLHDHVHSEFCNH